VAEWLIAPVLKTGGPKGLVSSNLTPSASSFWILDFRFLIASQSAALDNLIPSADVISILDFRLSIAPEPKRLSGSDKILVFVLDKLTTFFPNSAP
jgi:hypothetical protein